LICCQTDASRVAGKDITIRRSDCVGRVGALAVAFGIGGGLMATTGIATAQAAPQQHSAPNVSVSVNGVGFSSGSAKATSSFGSVAVAIGANSTASTTNGVLNRAVAIGQNNTVDIDNGNLNRAVVIGDGNTVLVANGSRNSVFVRGNGNGFVFAGGGNDNRITINGDENSAVAGCFDVDAHCPNTEQDVPRFGNHNTVVVRGNRNGAVAGSAGPIFLPPTVQRGNTTIVTGDDNPNVWAGWGSDNTTIVQGSRNTGGVLAGLGDRNTAIVSVDDDPDFVSAGGFGDHVPADCNVVIVDGS
jgi:hypothetical protein